MSGLMSSSLPLPGGEQNAKDARQGAQLQGSLSFQPPRMTLAPLLPAIAKGSASPSHRILRRSTSFSSSRREELDVFTSSFDSNAPASSSAGPADERPAYFDVYPRTLFTVRGKPQRAASERLPHPERNEQRGRASTQISYAFPTYDSADDLIAPTTPKSYTRTRSSTGPSGGSFAPPSPVLPLLHFSGSSSTQHTETTPPQTPVDLIASKESLDQFPVVVAAPISGVETMDALVDGMNGGDDVLLHAASISGRPRFGGIPGHHPLYQPPLPTPPPGIVLGGGKARRSKLPVRLGHSSDSESSQDHNAASTTRPRRRRPRQTAPRVPSRPTSPPALPSGSASTPKEESSSASIATPQRTVPEKRSATIPSIADIIRAHAPPEAHFWHRPSSARSSSYDQSQGHVSVAHNPEAGPLAVEDELDLISRSSMDSVADEVQRTLRNQIMANTRPPAPPPSSFSLFQKRQSTMSDCSLYSPVSDPGGGTSSLFSFSTVSSCTRPAHLETKSQNSIFLSKAPTPSREVAEYLRSARLTTLLRLTRSPHASQDNPLTISLSDLGSSTGHPVVVFLGLGCVRHVMGLYDEMAELMNLRLITIDRWGLGRTEPRAKSTKGIIQWASVVEEVLDLLQIEECSVMAHSAGAPYALSFANKAQKRIRGDICLLAPWVGGTESNGYKWLKYVPNSILKTAQAAEWKVQAWMLGKPPTITYEGIEYHAPSAQTKCSLVDQSTPRRSNSSSQQAEPLRRPSMDSNSFSEYDDLRDFDGRFESKSTLGAPRSEGKATDNNRKSSRGFLNRFKGSNSSNASTDEKPLPGGRTLKALRSMSSLKSKSSKKSESPTSPGLPPSLHVDIGFELHDAVWTAAEPRSSLGDSDSPPATLGLSSSSSSPYGTRLTGRRSISFSSPSSVPASPSASTMNSTGMGHGGTAFQAVLGNALIAASHAESAKGTHNDLLQILNHENYSWGFSYSSYPHTVKVWYGDKDEKIAETAVRWMVRTLGQDRCSLKIIQGADHGLLYRSSIVVEVLEHVLSFWEAEA